MDAARDGFSATQITMTLSPERAMISRDEALARTDRMLCASCAFWLRLVDPHDGIEARCSKVGFPRIA
jgi:hypothetical protein